MKNILKKIICLIPLIGANFIIITNNLEWYEKNKIKYLIWFLSSSLFFIIYFLYIYLKNN